GVGLHRHQLINKNCFLSRAFTETDLKVRPLQRTPVQSPLSRFEPVAIKPANAGTGMDLLYPSRLFPSDQMQPPDGTGSYFPCNLLTKDEPGLMTQARNSASDNPTFRVRATFAPLTHLELISFEPSRFEQELGEKSQQAPMFFRESPLVLSLERLAEPDQEIDFAHLLDICHRLEIKPIAIRGGTLVHQSSARGVGLLVLPANKSQAAAIEPEPAPEPAKVETPVAAPQPEPARRTKLIDHPVRSGQQIYAAGADLIVTAPVSPGAELLADGHIHVYGPLRRSEEHTSELQSRENLVCRLLLENPRTTETHPLSLHDALPICRDTRGRPPARPGASHQADRPPGPLRPADLRRRRGPDRDRPGQPRRRVARRRPYSCLWAIT